MQRIANGFSKIKKQMLKQVDALAAQNAANPVAVQLPVTLFNGLKAKINAETINPNAVIGAFRLVQINKGMQKLQRLIATQNQADATTKITRLIAFNVNPLG